MKKAISIGMSVFSGFCVLSAFYSEKTMIDYVAPAIMVAFLTYLQFSLSHDAIKQKGAAQWLSGTGALFLFVMAVAGNTIFWLAKTNTDSARLTVLERNLKLAETDKITSIAIRKNCKDDVVKGCIKPADADRKEKEQAFNNALITYNTMLSSISKQESFKIASSIVGEINQKQFLFVRAFVGSFFLEFGIVYFYLLSCAIPVESKSQALHPVAETQADFATQLAPIIAKKTYTDKEQECLTLYEDYESKGLILANGLPSSSSQFAAKLYGSQSGVNTVRAEAMLVKLGLVSIDTIKLEG